MLARTFLKEDFEDIQALLKEKSFDWQDLLSEEEYEVASVKKYFSEIAKNDARLVQRFKKYIETFKRMHADQRYMTVTSQLEDLDARDAIRSILHCFTRLNIRVLIDFFFMMFSKTRLALDRPLAILPWIFRDEPEIIYPSAGTAYPTKKTFLRNDDDIEEFVSHFGLIDHEILLDEHIAIRMAQSGVESGLNIGRIFGFRLFIECF